MPEEPSQSPPQAAPALAEELAGSLRCAACRYELRGLTIKGNCPECGLAIQATLLSLVDPRAAEIRPIRWPRLVALGANAWSMGAMLAVLIGWVVWASGFFPDVLGEPTERALILLGAAGLSLSGLGALTVIRPHSGIPVRHSVAALLGVMLYPVAVYLYMRLGAVASSGTSASMVAAMTGRADPASWRAERLAMWVILAVGALLLRSNLRALASRSLVMRAERVDRQTIAGSVAAVGIAAVGDALGLAAQSAGGWAGSLVLFAEVLVGLGAVLLTLGMVGIVLDTLRLTPAILQRPLAMSDLLAREMP